MHLYSGIPAGCTPSVLWYPGWVYPIYTRVFQFNELCVYATILTEKRLRCDYNSDSSSISGDKGELGDNDTGKRGRRSRADSGRFRKGDGAGEQRIGV